MTSKFHNLSRAALADTIGNLDAEVKAATARLDEAKAEFKRRGFHSAAGERFHIARTVSERTTLDRAAITAAMGEAWVAARSKSAPVVSLRITVNNAALAA